MSDNVKICYRCSPNNPIFKLILSGKFEIGVYAPFRAVHRPFELTEKVSNMV